MNKHIVRSGVAALTLGAVLFSATGLPAKADPTTTQDIIYAAAAAAGAFTLYNVEHKHQLATTVQGYLPDGSTVYEDGHVVSPNGVSWYPGNSGETVACSNQYCNISGGNGYAYNGYGYNNGYNGYNNGYNGNYGNSNRRYLGNVQAYTGSRSYQSNRRNNRDGDRN